MKYIKDYINITLSSRYVIHCETETESKIITEMVKKEGYADYHYQWDRYKENTCYNFPGGFGTVKHYTDGGYIIIKAMEFIQYEIY